MTVAEPLAYDVAIVGLGPVGATAALFLAEAGLRVAVVERERAIYPLPRAVALDGEVVRAFQGLGRAEGLCALLQTLRPGDRAGFANSRREWLFGQELADFGVNGWQPLYLFDQPELEAYLREALEAQEGVTLFLGETVTGFDDTGEVVRVETSARRLDASYLLACDGAASPVRKALGIGWASLGYDHDWLVVDIELRPGHTLPQDTLQVCDPDRLSTFVAAKDPYRRWEFRLNPGETAEAMLEEETLARLLDPWTPRGTYVLRRKAVYQFHAATAERWQVGRIFLLGDAAHQTPPFLGQGLNAGLRDVFNLAWKFPRVLSGAAPPTLLSSYEAERGPHASDMVEWAVALGRLMEHLAATEAAERAGEAPPAFDASRQSAGYGQGREAPPLREGLVVQEQVSDTGSAGYLFRQPWVQQGAGPAFPLDEVLGKDFALVSLVPQALTPETQAKLARLGVASVSLEGFALARGRYDDALAAGEAVLVRPDRYVFGHTSEALSLDALLERLSEGLGSTQSPR